MNDKIITVEAKEVTQEKKKRGRPKKSVKPSQVADGLTIKQKIFVNKYIETKGNGTRAALEAYNTDSQDVAKNIASENLTKPNVREAIQKALTSLELTPDYILNGFKDLHEQNKIIDATASTRALENIADIADMYPKNKTELDIGDGHLKISWE